MAAFLSGIVLAAGASKRMGSPKQLLPLRGKPLLQHVVDAAMASCLDEVIVVLGHRAEEVGAALRIPGGRSVRVVVNGDYATGQASSLRLGLRSADDRATAAAVLLGDQPDIDAARIDRVAAAFLAATVPVVRPVFAGSREEATTTGGKRGHVRHCRRVPGHPVFFARRIWPEIEALEGDQGARTLLATHPEWLLELEIAAAAPADVDTPQEYDELR